MKFKGSFHPYAITTIIFWSFAYVLTRLALKHFTAFPLGFLRYLFASGTLLVMALATKMKAPRRSDLKLFAVSGALGFFLYMMMFNMGSMTVTASTASIVIATVPVITAVLAGIVYKERLGGIQRAAIAVEFGGILILTLSNGIFSVNRGLIFLLIAAFSLSGYNILQRKLTKTYTPLASSAYGIFAGTLMLSLFAPTAVGELKTAAPAQVMYVLAMGVFSSAIAYIAWAKAFSKAEKTSSVSNYMFLTPFLTSVLGFVMAGETPEPHAVAAGAVILSGVLIFNLGGRKHIPEASGTDEKIRA